MKEHSGVQYLWRRANAPEQCKISKFASNSHLAKNIMFIYKITEVNFLMSLREYNDVTIAINDAAPYTLCLEFHKNLISTAIPFTISQINPKIMHIQEIEQ